MLLSLFPGEIGNGAKMKLVINGLMGTVISGLAESLALAEKAGLDQDEVLTVLEMSALASPIISSKARGKSVADLGIVNVLFSYFLLGSEIFYLAKSFLIC